MKAELYYLQLAAAFVRGRALLGDPIALTDEQQNAAIDEIDESQLIEIFRAGVDAGLKLHKFKRTMELARVRRILGALQAVLPEQLLDIGSGRGVFLWPLLDAFPTLEVTAIDRDARRAEDLDAVRQGGVARLSAFEMDSTELSFADDQFDVVTMLEVLEHIPTPSKAVREVVRVARRFVLLSVPSKPDDNPEHIHLFDESILRGLLADAGVERVSFDYVLNHMIVVANTAGGE